MTRGLTGGNSRSQRAKRGRERRRAPEGERPAPATRGVQPEEATHRRTSGEDDGAHPYLDRGPNAGLSHARDGLRDEPGPQETRPRLDRRDDRGEGADCRVSSMNERAHVRGRLEGLRSLRASQRSRASPRSPALSALPRSPQLSAFLGDVRTSKPASESRTPRATPPGTSPGDSRARFRDCGRVRADGCASVPVEGSMTLLERAPEMVRVHRSRGRARTGRARQRASGEHCVGEMSRPVNGVVARVLEAPRASRPVHTTRRFRARARVTRGQDATGACRA